MADIREDKLTYLIREWVKQTGGRRFTSREIDHDLNLDSTQAKALKRGVLKELCDKGETERVGSQQGIYRLREVDLQPLNWPLADPNAFLRLKWPFGLEKLVNIYPKSIVVLAGVKSAGKTAYALNFIRINMEKFKVRLFNSEMGAEEFKKRIMNFNGIKPSEWTFEAYERTGDFADVIDPDAINIIDFLEITDTFYMIGQYIKAIFDKLNKGIALVVIQKNEGAEFGLGRERSMEKARLYINLDRGLLTIKEAKNWAEGVTMSPRGRKWSFNLINGCQFINIEEKF